jgi:hypothetical protein
VLNKQIHQSLDKIHYFRNILKMQTESLGGFWAKTVTQAGGFVTIYPPRVRCWLAFVVKSRWLQL